MFGSINNVTRTEEKLILKKEYADEMLEECHIYVPTEYEGPLLNQESSPLLSQIAQMAKIRLLDRQLFFQISMGGGTFL